MTHKYSYSYLILFEYLKNLLKHMGIKFKFENAHIITDYEHPLRKALFTNSKLEGCFFNYSKALWKRAKKYGLIAKKG